MTAAPSATPAAQVVAADADVTLPNGMRVIVVVDRLAPVALTALAYGVGSADDTAPGIAHATEHMLFRGTQALSAQQLAAIEARMGAVYDAYTAEQSTVYWYRIPAAYVPVALAIEADRMRGARITEADWSTERGAIEQEVRAFEGNPIAGPAQKLRDAFFAGTPFAHTPIGTKPAFDALHADQIRAFYQRWYVPSNATLIVAGDVDPHDVVRRARAAFGAIDAPPVPAHAAFTVPDLAVATVNADVDFPLPLAAIGFRFPGRHDPDYAAAQVLAVALQSARGPFGTLSTSGKVLAAFPVASAFRELGAFAVFAIPARGEGAAHALSLVQGIIDACRAGGVPPELIEVAKARLLAGFATRAASISGLGLSWLDAEQAGTTPAALAAAVAAVTPADVDAALRKYVAPGRAVTMQLTPKPTKNVAAPASGPLTEHVGVEPESEQRLPAWATAALDVPLVPATYHEEAAVFGRLPNGVRYAIRRETSAPAVIVKGIVRTAPALYEPRGKDGVQQVVDTLLGWGTQTLTLDQYQRAYDALAANWHVGFSFSLGVRSEDLERGLGLLADGLLHPSFAPDAFVVAKSTLAQSVAAADGMPSALAADAERKAMYGPSDPRRRVATDATVAAITLDDVRKYYRFACRPDVTAIVVVGDVDPKRVAAALRAAFGGWRANGPPPSFRYPVPKERRATSLTVKSATATQSQVTLRQTIPLRVDDPDYVPLLLANTILSGEGMGSLLMRELRTRKGYVYDVSSSLTVDQSGGTFTLSYASDPRDAQAANASALAVLRRLREHPLPLDDLQRAKALLLAQRILPLDSFEGVADDMLAGADGGLDQGTAWYWRALLRVTPAQLQHAMRRIDPDRFVRLTVQPG